jgi:hypothetical protein
MHLRPAVGTLREAVPARCPTCGDGSGWLRWRLRGRWLWASCDDCNTWGRKAKPPVCAGCGVTAPFCTCLTRVA